MDYDDFFDTEDFDLLLDEIFNDDDDDGNLSNRLNFNDKVQTTEDSIVSKDGSIWSKVPISDVNKTYASNKINFHAGVPKEVLDKIKTPIDAFKLFLTEDITNSIIEDTNNFAKENISDWKPIDKTEMDGMIGFLLLCGTLEYELNGYWNPKFDSKGDSK
ncbi:hypothetical protein BLOT_012401 [Blomia tropicalis]|nr:hypothetical protein BLOT_012401 [Blomia tropicalis]